MSISDDLVFQSREAEWYLCASAYINQDIVRSDCGYISPGDFADENLSKFWRRFLDGDDVITISMDLGIFSDIVDTVMKVPTIHHLHYASKVSENSYRRRVANGLSKIAVAVSDGDVTKIRELSQHLSSINPENSDVLFTPEDIDLSFRDMVFAGDVSIKTFVTDFDKDLGGFFPGELTILAARPGMGKTSFCLNMARNIAFSGKRVLFFSLEMSKEQLWARMACPLVGVQWTDVRSGVISPADKANLEIESVALAARLKDKLFVHDEIYTLPEIHRLCLSYNPSIVFIDQLPEIQWHGDETEEVKWYGLACKYVRTFIAKGLRVPVVLVHQLSREVDTRTDRRPVLKDLRWSGEVEQRADVVLFLYRGDYYDGRPSGAYSVPLEVLVRKNRQGEMNQTVILDYNLKTQVMT